MSNLKEQVEFIAKQCECLVEGFQWYEDMDDEERKRYDTACANAEGEIAVGAYLQDAYDVMYYVHSNFNAKGIDGVRYCVALGGPNIYINTYTGKVEGAWGCESASVDISDGACDVINAFAEEFISC